MITPQEIVINDLMSGHEHLREGPLLDITILLDSCYSCVVDIPNTKDPVDSGEKLEARQKEIALRKPDFQIIHGIMLTKRTTKEGIKHAYDLGARFIKYIPANASTNAGGADIGITIDEFPQYFYLLEYAFSLGMVFLMHVERMHTKKGTLIPFIDREEAGIEDADNLIRNFPGKKIRIEHVSTKTMIDFIRNTPPCVMGGFAPQHARKTFNQVFDAFNNTIQENFCMPILKHYENMRAVRREMALGDHTKFTSTIDNALHTWKMKLKGMPGCFLPPPVPLSIHAEIFESFQVLDKLPDFVCFTKSTEEFFGVKLTKRKRVTLINEPWIVPETIRGIVPFLWGERLNWKIKEVVNLY